MSRPRRRASRRWVRCAAGSIVNLERPLRADARLGGHFVQGHVDATGTIEEIRPEGESLLADGSISAARWRATSFSKGSIAVDGISLTVAGVDDRRFDVQIIPVHVGSTPTLPRASKGDAVNLECDILGKYVVRAPNSPA